MKGVRIYGKDPFIAALVHGGPGARGEMAPVARELSKNYGVIEPLQSLSPVKGLLHELSKAVAPYKPMVVIGHSWGAWLSFLFASEYPDYIRKLIMVGSAPFTEKYAPVIMRTRFDRLDEDSRYLLSKLQAELAVENTGRKSPAMDEFDRLIAKTDNFDPLPLEFNPVKFDPASYKKIWPEAEELRKKGSLLEAGRNIKCPVTAIHGDYDPHPADGVRIPLEGIISNFEFIELEKCGHTPWIEKYAREPFFQILKTEIDKAFI